MKELIRHCVFRPYTKGSGNPIFHLYLYDIGQRDYRGKNRLAYKLTRHSKYSAVAVKSTIFEGNDFACSPMHAVDSDETVESIMGFLTLRPGDTDSEYFKDYTTEQLTYCDFHAEALQLEVMARFEKR